MASEIDISVLRNPKDKHDSTIIPFVATFNPNSPNVYSHIHQNISVLHQSNRMHSALDDVRVIKSNRQGPNLKKLLTRAKFDQCQNNGSRKCNTPRCKCCEDICETTQVSFHISGHVFSINDEMNCESENLIYVLICKACDEYYIGQTGDKLRSRCRVHRQGVTNNSSIFF